jgi:hypothetical protein
MTFTSFINSEKNMITNFNKEIVVILLFMFGAVCAKSQVVLSYNHEAGFYSIPFDLTLELSDNTYKIAYTLDGSDPQSSRNAFIAASPVVIRIDPEDTSYRSRTPGVVVRATIKNGDNFIGKSLCKTYIFLNQVKSQIYPGGKWPVESPQSVNKQNIDYTMDSSVVNNPEYKDLIDSALISIPTISIVTETGNLFDPARGIYVHSLNSGDDWERECSVELIYPDNTQKFQINAGLRLKGDWSRQPQNPKFSLRLVFRNEYGAGELNYPLFETEGTSNFGHIDLRTEQNCSWSFGFDLAYLNTFLRDAFARDAQRDMKWPYIRSRFCHLYINGMYWGLYMTYERVDKDYAKSYFGGAKTNYDIIKVDEIVDGNSDSWKELWSLTNSGFETNAKYFALEGKNKIGQPIQSSHVICDIDNLIDYMSIVFYTGNFDGPISIWGGRAANYIALKDRTDGSFGYKFFALDFEYSMMVDSIYNVGIGINQNRVKIQDFRNGQWVYSKYLSEFNPQWLHYKLTENPEYRMRFIDRAYNLFKENGQLTPEKSMVRLKIREQQIEKAIIAESARWGDTETGENPAYTKKDWENAVNSLKNIFIPERTNIVIQQLKDDSLFSDLIPPDIAIRGRNVSATYYYITGKEKITIKNTSDIGVVYYTLNGSDPRNIGGAINSNAMNFSSDSLNFIASSSLIINARIKSDNKWGPLRKLNILVPVSSEDYSYFKVTELNYHPADERLQNGTIDGDEFEFIEFKNTGTSCMNISGLTIDSAIHYIVPPNIILAPHEYYVVARKPVKFFDRYSMKASGNYSNNFSNSGEYVLVEDSLHNKILSFTYSDSYPWPLGTDGDSYTLVSVEKDPTGDPNDYNYWTRSKNLHGNPFSDTVLTVLPDNTGVNRIVALKFSIYPNPTSDILKVESISENNTKLTVLLYDMYGKLIFEHQFNVLINISLKDLKATPGIYVLTIRNNTGLISKKILFH